MHLNLNHTGISVGNTVHLKYRILSVCKSSKLFRYIEKVVSADVTLKYRWIMRNRAISCLECTQAYCHRSAVYSTHLYITINVFMNIVQWMLIVWHKIMNYMTTYCLFWILAWQLPLFYMNLQIVVCQHIFFFLSLICDVMINVLVQCN